MKYKIQWLYKTKRGLQTELTTDYMNIEEALQFAEDFEKTGRVKELSFYDEMDAEWSLKEMKKLSKQVEEELQEIYVYFDGGYDLQTKEAGVGICVYYKKEIQTTEFAAMHIWKVYMIIMKRNMHHCYTV